jgi:hypothetical protein
MTIFDYAGPRLLNYCVSGLIHFKVPPPLIVTQSENERTSNTVECKRILELHFLNSFGYEKVSIEPIARTPLLF